MAGRRPISMRGAGRVRRVGFSLAGGRTPSSSSPRGVPCSFLVSCPTSLRSVARRTNSTGVTELSHPFKVTLPAGLIHPDGTGLGLTVTRSIQLDHFGVMWPLRVLLDALLAGLRCPHLRWCCLLCGDGFALPAVSACPWTLRCLWALRACTVCPLRGTSCCPLRGLAACGRGNGPASLSVRASARARHALRVRTLRALTRWGLRSSRVDHQAA